MREVSTVSAALVAADFKARVHLAQGETADDYVITALLASAQDVVERATRRIMSGREVEFICRPYGAKRWYLPVCPVMSLTEAHWQDDTGAWVPLDVADIRLEMPEDEPQLVFADGLLDALSEQSLLKVKVAVGNDALGPARQQIEAAYLIAKSWYEAHMTVAEAQAATEASLPFGATALIRQVVYRRPDEFGAV